MASDTESVTLLPTGASELPSIERASTPSEANISVPSSQATIPPTEAPGSPLDDADASIKAESQDGRIASPTVVPSSMTPPPHPADGTAVLPHASTTMTNGIPASQTSSLVSPPATVPNGTVRRTVVPAAPYTQPTLTQTRDASAGDLREMLSGAIEELGRIRGELAGWRFRVNQLTRNEEEYAERHHVELDMMHREIEALCEAERVRQMSQVPIVPRSVQADYETLQRQHHQLQGDYKSMQKKLKAAKRIIQEKDEANLALQDDKDMLLNRLRENREHAQQLLSPGKILHPTPKSSSHHHHAMSTPQTGRTAPRETPRSAIQPLPENGRFAALLNVLQNEGNNAPVTPLVGHHPPPRASSGFKGHTRNVQSMSSIPTTPHGRPRGEHAGLLPSVDLVPRTEPRYNTNPFRPVNAPVLPPISSTPPAPTGHAHASTGVQRASSGEKSRESTISADEDNTQELARQALQQFHRNAHQAVEEDSRFDAARDGTPAAAEKTVRMHAKLFGQGEKRKHDEEATGQPRRGLPTSPKRVKLPGLGIRDSR